ncbi:hypothetical protein CROQUDRAFT_716113 [Cronartium quercuum f. sp. fusiforme G11]|uniref:Uncharacterized protein n=1 Tax=Cronartium quercuum f. sp. fusiforme G11 TaxID=708437 RepID=A0A9P6TC86_9BASI|nr:hypothetical protein CROQUDRAFT_716113 [Cronartium quercuum f. sp. fusiforme G11]
MTSSSSSLLNIWARGTPTDQLTPKASARAGTSTETDPFDNLNSIHSPNSISPIKSNSVQSKHKSTSDDTLSSGLQTPMPNSPQPNQQYFNHQHSSTSQGLAATALKAITHQNPNKSSSNEFSFTTNPLNHAKNVLSGTRHQSNLTSSSHKEQTTSTTSNQTNLNLFTLDDPITASGSRTPIMIDNRKLIDDITNAGNGHDNLFTSTLTDSPTDDHTTHSITQPPKGLLSVKIISARALSCTSSHSRPYVVATFDNNEFVSREPIAEEEDEIRGITTNKSNLDSHHHHHHNKSIDIGTLDSPKTLSNVDSTISTDGKGPPTYDENHLHNEGGQKEKEKVGKILSNGNGMFCLSGQNPIWKQELDFDVAQHEHLNASHRTLHVSVYDRSIGDNNQTNLEDDQQSQQQVAGIEGVELFIGETEIEINFEQLAKNSGWYDQWYQLGTTSSSQTGEIRIQLRYKEIKTKKSLSVSDFEFLKMIGKGTFGRVFQVRKKDTKRIYAMKVLSKKEVIDKKEVQHTLGERNILQQSNSCPFLLGLKFSFQSLSELFLVMDYKSGGELFHHLQKEGRFTEERARFYTAEIVLALEHLHTYNIVYRDLKPENILLDATGHIVLCDFGLSKPNLSSDELTTTFCGTTEYLAPEVLLDDHGYSKLVDFWSLGVLLFEMCCGWSPFYAEDNQQMYKNICFGKIKFPRGVIGDDGKQFVKGLLNRNPKHRLGSQNDTEDLKSHPFFKSIDWLLLLNRQIVPTFKPFIDSDESVVNFDPEFTKVDINLELLKFDESDRSADWVAQAVAIKPIELNSRRHIDDNMQDHFRGFSYHGESEMVAAAQSKFGMSSIRD